jgi:bifunctional DNA-binding transcriptional regulator/antitoxin component of YhaV-PrlF toxin-antitoxin module
MAKVTSKYQVSVPVAIAEMYNIRPGSEIEWVPAGDVIRVLPPGKHNAPADLEQRLRLFDQATERHRRKLPLKNKPRLRGRGWSREDLYGRGGSH